MLVFMATSVQAQTQMTVTTKDGSSFVNSKNTATFDYDNQTVNIGNDTILPMGQLRSIDFLRDGLPWNMMWKYMNVTRGSYYFDFGYPSIMHLRDVMTEDMPVTNSWNRWYAPWSRDNSIDKNTMATYFVNYYLMMVIADANRIIRATKDADTDEDKAILGTAYASRASIYLDYARMYEFLPNDRLQGVAASGKDITGLTVPIIDETINAAPKSGYYSQPRATKAEMVAFIESDLDKAEQLAGYITDPTPLLPHLDVVYGLKARLYLWAGDYDKARTYAERAIAETKTTIMTESQMTDTGKGFNDGNLWMWCIRNFETDASTISTNINWASFMCNEYGLGYTNTAVYMPSINAALYNRINVSDIRKQLFVAPEDNPLYGKQQKINPQQYLQEYVSLKFRPANGITNSPKGAEVDIPLMRVEEMYLIAAEAAAHQSPQEGLRLLREFMSHRDAHYSFNASTESDIVNEIILQKRIELWGEGQTFFDVKRLNMDVTRDYEGSNFYDADRINTHGRPAWMNFVFSYALELKNLSLIDNNNPDPSGIYSSNYKPLTAEDARAAITSGIVLHEPLWKADLPWLPLDSLSLVSFRFDKAQTDKQDVSLDYKFEISLSPDFPVLKTVPLPTHTNYNADDIHLSYNDDFISNVEYLRNALGITGDEQTKVYMRVKGYVSRCPEVNIVSNTIDFGVINRHPGKLSHYSYMPDVEVTPLDNIDLDDLIEVKNPKVCNITKKGDGELLNNTFGVLHTDGAVLIHNSFSLDEQGYYSQDEYLYSDDPNNYLSRRLQNLSDFWNRKTYPGTTVMKASLNGIKYKNDLHLYYHTDSFQITVTLSKQLWEENRYRWGESVSKPFISQLNSKYSRNVGYRKALYDEIHPEEDGDIYIINKPYSNFHNLLVYVDKDGKASVPSQWAYTDDDKRVYVEGTGTFDGGLFDMQLTFAYKGGETIGTFNEVIGDEWVDLGYGTLSDSFFSINDCQVKIKQNTKNRSKFRVNLPYMGMYGNEASEYMDLTIMPKGSVLNDKVLPQEAVYFTEANTGYYYETYGGYLYIEHPSSWYEDDVNKWIDSKVLDYQDNGLPGEIELNPLYTIKNIGSFGKYPMSIVFPGWRARDYSVEMSDVTAEKDEQGKAYAITTLTLGTDAQDVRACVFNNMVNLSDALETLGNHPEYRVSVENGTIRVSFNGEHLSGNLSLYVGVFDKTGNLRDYSSGDFEFYPHGDPWQSIGQGTFTDDILSSLYGLEPVTYSVEIMENQSKPGLYRVMKPYANDVYPYAKTFAGIDGDSYYIEIDATDPEGVFIPTNDICVFEGEKYSFCSVGAYYMENEGYDFTTMKGAGYLGRLTDGLITFPAIGRGGIYQGVVLLNGSAYTCGSNGKIEIRLPSAAASNNEKRLAPAVDTKKAKPVIRKSPENRVLTPLTLPALKDR